MKLGQKELERAKQALKNLPAAPWSRIAAQILDFGDEAHFWVMANSVIAVPDCVRRFAETTEPLFHMFEDTEFYLAVFTRDGTSQVQHAFIVDDELRSGLLALELGEEQGTLVSSFNEAFWRKHG